MNHHKIKQGKSLILLTFGSGDGLTSSPVNTASQSGLHILSGWLVMADHVRYMVYKLMTDACSKKIKFLYNLLQLKMCHIKYFWAQYKFQSNLISMSKGETLGYITIIIRCMI